MNLPTLTAPKRTLTNEQANTKAAAGAALQEYAEMKRDEASKPIQPPGPPPGYTAHRDNANRCAQLPREHNPIPDSDPGAGHTDTVARAMARNIEAANAASEDEWVSRFGCTNPDCGFLRHSKESVSETHCCKRCRELDTHWRSDVQHQNARGHDTHSTTKHGKKCEGLAALDAFIAFKHQAATTATESPAARIRL